MVSEAATNKIEDFMQKRNHEMVLNLEKLRKKADKKHQEVKALKAQLENKDLQLAEEKRKNATLRRAYLNDQLD